MSSLSSLVQPSAGKRAGAGSASIADALEALRIEAGSRLIAAGAQSWSGKAPAYGELFSAGGLPPGGADAWIIAPHVPVPVQVSVGDDICVMPKDPGPVLKPALDEASSGGEESVIVCIMPKAPVAPDDEEHNKAGSGGDWLSGLIGDTAAFSGVAGVPAHDLAEDWLSGLIDSTVGGSNVVTAPAYGPAEASFASCYDGAGGYLRCL